MPPISGLDFGHISDSSWIASGQVDGRVNIHGWFRYSLLHAGSSWDGTIKSSALATGEVQQTMQSVLPYKGMIINDVIDLTQAEINSLKALGAIAACKCHYLFSRDFGAFEMGNVTTIFNPNQFVIRNCGLELESILCTENAIAIAPEN